MKFFLPAAENEVQAERAYGAIVKFVSDNMSPVRPERYHSISYRHNGRDLKAVVGEPEALTGETVVAILRSKGSDGPFYICTPNRGVIRDMPVMASGGHDTVAVLFDEP